MRKNSGREWEKENKPTQKAGYKHWPGQHPRETSGKTPKSVK